MDNMLSRTTNVESGYEKIEVARSLVESIREAAYEVDERRCVTKAVFKKLTEAGLVNLLKPERFGGDPVSLKVAIQVVHELARGDASVAWVQGVFTAHCHLVGLFPENVQQEYWASSAHPLCASSVVPTGKATKVDGGFELTGQWPFCSGVDFANWAYIGTIIGVKDGIADRRFFLVPESDYEIVDDWHVMGLRGSGSKSIKLEGVFVPDAKMISHDDVESATTPGASTHPANEFKYPAASLLTFTLVGMATMIARNAYEHTVVALKAGQGKPNPLFEARRSPALTHLAEASAKIDAAELTYARALDETFALVDEGKELPIELRVRNRRDQCFAAKLAHEAASELFSIGGANGIRESAVVQRAQRDLWALSLHPASNWDATAQSFGSFLMTGEPAEPIY